MRRLIVKSSKLLHKDLKNLPKEIREKLGLFLNEEISQISSLTQLKNIQKLRGHANFFRIRFGDYRLGISYDGKELILHRIIHRKEFYRYFP